MLERRYYIAIPCLLLFFLAGTVPDGFSLLFNGTDLSGWVNVIGSESTWNAGEKTVRTTGKPRCVLRTAQQYENFILEVEFRAENFSGRGGLILHGDALPAAGMPWPRGIDIRLGGTNGSVEVEPVGGARIEPAIEDGRGGHRENKQAHNSKTAEWHHYRIESRDGHLTVKRNGQTVATANYASPRKGYIALKSDGSEVRYRNIRIRELPSTDPKPYEVADSARGFVSLYDGLDLAEHWEMKPGHRGHWTARDWYIDYDGSSEEQDKSLWSQSEFGDFVLVADMRFTRKPEPDMLPVVLPDGREAKLADGSTRMVEVFYAGDSGIYLRGSSKNQVNMGNRYIGSGEIYGYRVDESMPQEVRRAVVPRVNADHPPGEWNRYLITMKGDRVSVVLNGWLVIDRARLPGIAPKGKIALQDDHARDNRFQFGNLYIRELD